MSTANIIPNVNAFIKTIQAVPIRFKVENLPAVAKSFVTIPAGPGAVRLEIMKGTTLCIHVYGSLKAVRKDLKVDFQLSNRVYTSPLLTRSEDIAELLTVLGTLLPEVVGKNCDIECVTKEIGSAIHPFLAKRSKTPSK